MFSQHSAKVSLYWAVRSPDLCSNDWAKDGYNLHVIWNWYYLKGSTPYIGSVPYDLSYAPYKLL